MEHYHCPGSKSAQNTFSWTKARFLIKLIQGLLKNITDDKADIVKMDNMEAFCLRCVVWPVLWVVWTWHRAWDTRRIFMLSRFSPRATHTAAGRTLQTGLQSLQHSQATFNTFHHKNHFINDSTQYQAQIAFTKAKKILAIFPVV